jgi:two-component system, sporulation sensor kinase E
MARKSPLDKVLGKLEDLDEVNLSNLVQRLARERKLLETVFDVIRDGILVLDRNGFITYSNQQGRKLIGLKSELGDKVSLLRAAPDLAKSLGIDRFSDDVRPEVIVREVLISYPDKRYLRIYAVPIEGTISEKSSSQDAGLAVVLTDITEEKTNVEEQIENEKVSSIMDLAAGVAHELGNPLNSVNIHLQVLHRTLKKADLATNVKAKLEKSLQSCTKEVDRLDSIILHFLKAIRPSTPDFKELNLLSIIEEILHLKERELSGKKIKIELESKSKDPIIKGDSEQIKQVFFNVIGNAVDAIPDHSEIRILISGDDDFIIVQIIDHGEGIKKENASKVFEPYFTTKKQGNGIGMMIVHRTMRNHGGEVGIDSKHGSGTIVTLKFPRKVSRVRYLEQK